MKQIVEKLPEDMLTFDSLPQNPIIGFVYGKDDRGWIQRNTYKSDSYTNFLVSNGVSVANGVATNDEVPLKELIKLLKAFSVRFYLFDSEKELFTWLAKD